MRPVAAVFRSPLFNASEGFVQAQAAGLERYQPLVVGLEDKGNIDPRLEGRVLLADHRLRFRLGWAGAMADRLRPHRPALVHAHFATDGLLALPLAEALGVKLVTTLHGYDVSRSRASMLGSGRLSWMRYALFQRRLMARGALFLAVSEALRRQALARGYPAERTLTHYLGVDLKRFAGAGTPEPGLILHVGRLVEKKGTSVLLDAFARLGRGQLVVIGDGPLRGALERQAQGLGGTVRFLGALPPAEVAGWMRRAWLLAAPSVTARDGDAEGLPTVIVEAAASALPAIGSDHSGIPEAISEGETGFLVPERDAGALAARLAELLDARDLRHRMGAAARRLAKERFDAARQIARLESLYDEVIGARPDRGGADNR
ncbi:MAG TPA: glycosyltransferase [Allosphingosinicella sp.]|nr:glycosyltransferase [Allosphingosinicella sp.]